MTTTLEKIQITIALAILVAFGALMIQPVEKTTIEYRFTTNHVILPDEDRVTTVILVDQKEYYAMKAKECFKDSECSKLAEALYHEDRGAGVDGMVAVGHVILNRVSDRRWPDTVAEVIEQKRKNSRGVVVCQFSYVCLIKDKSLKEKPSKILSGYVAHQVLSGKLDDITNGADHYYNPSLVPVAPKFARVHEEVATVGEHVFFRS